MGEHDGLVAVEVVDYPGVYGNPEVLDRHDAVVEHSAHDYVAVRSDGPDEFYVLCQYGVPCILDLEEHNLVQRLECHLMRIGGKAPGNLFPEREEPCLKGIVIEELLPVHVFLQRVKGVAVALVEVYEHVEPVHLAPLPAVLQIAEPALYLVAGFIFKDIVVHGNPYVVESQT